MAKYSHIRTSLITGDLVVFYKKWFFLKKISHIGLVVVPFDKVFLWESLLPTKRIRERDLEDAVFSHKGTVEIRKIKLPLNNNQEKLLQAYREEINEIPQTISKNSFFKSIFDFIFWRNKSTQIIAAYERIKIFSKLQPPYNKFTLKNFLTKFDYRFQPPIEVEKG